MPRKNEWAIRVIQSHKSRDALPGLWQEQFRRLGLLKVIQSWDGTEGGMECFEIYGREPSREWAVMNAERMTSFGINAVPAPRAMSFTEAKALHEEIRADLARDK